MSQYRDSVAPSLSQYKTWRSILRPEIKYKKPQSQYKLYQEWAPKPGGNSRRHLKSARGSQVAFRSFVQPFEISARQLQNGYMIHQAGAY
eukprot:3626788-Rhodomonas_salina.3